MMAAQPFPDKVSLAKQGPSIALSENVHKKVIQDYLFNADNPVETGKFNEDKSVTP